MGLNVKLDVGLYRLDQQVACQRYRQNLLDANLKDRVVGVYNSLVAAITPRTLAVNFS